jgi:Acyl-CoA dehydrogenase, C-terminal domain
VSTAFTDQDFVFVSRKAIAGSTGSDALATLGWWDLLGELGDPEARAAMFALFRAEGLELGNTCALGALAAAPYLDARNDHGTVVASIRRQSVRRGPVDLLVGDTTVDHILFDRPGIGAALVPATEVTMRRVDIPGRLAVHEVEVDAARLAPSIDVATARVARAQSEFLGRLAISFEILGAAEAALALAVEHATGRVQFGQEIGKFQAVRHLLAWALTDCAAVESVAVAARDLYEEAPDRFDQVVKALAGRNGRRACERTLQVLGAIGFTAELDHHHFHSRVLLLDSLLASSTELTVQLGAWLREEHPDPKIAHAVLLAAT